MAYIPEDIVFDSWHSPRPIVGSDRIADLDEAMNYIISDNNALSLQKFFNQEMGKVPNYLSEELVKINAEVLRVASDAMGYRDEAKAYRDQAEGFRDDSQAIYDGVVTEGSTQVNRVIAEGDTQDARVIAEGTTQTNRVIAEGTTQIGLATAEADRAKTEADKSQLRAWEAEAEKKTADSYANEPKDVFVKRYTSNGDGTFSSTDTTDYSSRHWAISNTNVTKDYVDMMDEYYYRLLNYKIDG